MDKITSNENQIHQTHGYVRATTILRTNPLFCHISICNLKFRRLLISSSHTQTRFYSNFRREQQQQKMAASASPMASQLRSSFSSTSLSRRLAVPKGISGASFGVSPTKRVSSFTIRAVKSDKVYIFINHRT